MHQFYYTRAGIKDNDLQLTGQEKRILQHSMTTDPDKVWPGGILPYQIGASIGNE